MRSHPTRQPEKRDDRHDAVSQAGADTGCGDSNILPKVFAMIANQDEAKLMLAACPDDAIVPEEIRPQDSIPA